MSAILGFLRMGVNFESKENHSNLQPKILGNINLGMLICGSCITTIPNYLGIGYDLYLVLSVTPGDVGLHNRDNT